MKLYEALQIAKQHPRAFVTRGEDGFVVRSTDGSLLTSAPIANDLEALRRENKAKLEELAQAHRAEIVGLEARIMEIYAELHDVRTERDLLASELEQLQKRAKKVSPAEWERISRLEETERAKKAKDMKSARYVKNCPCRGEVENCARCSGKGTYVADGYGNIVNE